MPLPILSHALCEGLAKSVKKDDTGEFFLEKLEEMCSEEPVLKAMMEQLHTDCDDDETTPHALECKVGITLGMVYVYMLYRAQADSDDLEQQWG